MEILEGTGLIKKSIDDLDVGDICRRTLIFKHLQLPVSIHYYVELTVAHF